MVRYAILRHTYNLCIGAHMSKKILQEHTCTHACRHTHMHTHTYTYTHADTPIHTYTYTAHTHTHTHMHGHKGNHISAPTSTPLKYTSTHKFSFMMWILSLYVQCTHPFKKNSSVRSLPLSQQPHSTSELCSVHLIIFPFCGK